MPSNKDPNIIQPGPGKLPAGSVPASAIAFPIGGAGDLAAHIADPVDAHMSGAIGIPELNPITGLPLLSSAGGPYDGESVLDALTALSDLLPIRPDKVGFDSGLIPNSGFPNWSNALTVGGSGVAIHGGWTGGGVGIVTKYLTPAGSVGAQTVGGTVYPADRGVLALYKTTNGDFFNSAQTTLVAALWLGVNPPPAGIPGAAFNEVTRPTSQPNYVPSMAGLDLIGLTARLPYLASYPGLEYAPYSVNFTSYQLAKYSFAVTLVGGDSDSYLLVHWKELYATTLAAIQPLNLTALTLVTANCYSAVPSDPTNYTNVNRLNIFVDTASGTSATAVAITTAPAGTTTTVMLSGVRHYNSTGLQFDITASANNVFQNSYYTNDAVSGSVPTGFTSTVTPASVLTTPFGGISQSYPLYDGAPSRILDDGTALPFSLVSPPGPATVARFQHPTHPIGGSANAIPFPYGRVSVEWHSTFGGSLLQNSVEVYIYNPLSNTLTTNTFEPFNDESYRYISAYAAGTSLAPILPAGGDVYSSVTALVSGDGNLQVLSGRLVYPSIDFQSPPINPISPANYASVLTGDAGNHKRRYIRAFDTGVARNTGKLRVTGVGFSSFDAGLAAIDPAEITDHPGGMIVQIKVPGASGWLDLGRADGTPDLNKALDFRGCRTGIAGDVYSFDTGLFTSDNGSGRFLLFVRITLIKNGVGQTLDIQEIEWLPP